MKKNWKKKLHVAVVGGALALQGLLVITETATAAETYVIPVVLPLSGNAAFLGQGERDALKIQADLINARGDLKGTELQYKFYDDQSSPQVAVQLANQIVADHPAIVIGSGLVAMCNAMTPIFANGPVQYCLSPGVHPPEGSLVFSAFVSTHDAAIALIRYYRGRGFTKLGMITSTDASGQDGARGFNEAIAMPENKGLEFVASVKFAPADVSVAAQVEEVRTSGAEALIVWTSGAPFGTVLKSIAQTGLGIPVATTDANMTFAQMQQYAAFMPKEALFMSTQWSSQPGSKDLDPAVLAAQKDMNDSYKAAGMKPDVASAHAWDTGLLVIKALQEFGISATGEQIRTSISKTVGWRGVNGIYDFVAMPQRGLNVSQAVVTRWKSDSKTWDLVSKPGGDLIGSAR